MTAPAQEPALTREEIEEQRDELKISVYTASPNSQWLDRRREQINRLCDMALASLQKRDSVNRDSLQKTENVNQDPTSVEAFEEWRESQEQYWHSNMFSDREILLSVWCEASRRHKEKDDAKPVDGMVMVPHTATEVMLLAGLDARYQRSKRNRKVKAMFPEAYVTWLRVGMADDAPAIADEYRAMIDAALEAQRTEKEQHHVD